MRQVVFTIRLPGDLHEKMEDYFDSASNQAREEAEDYVIPAQWEVEHVSGNIGDWEMEFRVTRTSN